MDFFNSYRTEIGYALMVLALAFPVLGDLRGKLPVLWDKMRRWFHSNNTSKVQGTSSVIPEEMAEVEALYLLQKRFERFQNKEGQKAIETVKREFFINHAAENVNAG